MYRLDESLPGDAVSELEDGTSLLISGPPMMGKERLAIDILGSGLERGDGVLVISTGSDADRLIGDLERSVSTLDRDHVGIIDCTGGGDQQTIKDIATQRVSSPSDLTGISIGTAKLLKRFEANDVTDVRHGLVSVSTLLQYLDLNTVYKFLHIYTSRIGETDGLGVFTIDSSAHDQQTVNTIFGEFDGVVDLRETDGGDRQVRVRGFRDAPRGWRSFDDG